jgi:hypothetical protein
MGEIDFPSRFSLDIALRLGVMGPSLGVPGFWGCSETPFEMIFRKSTASLLWKFFPETFKHW